MIIKGNVVLQQTVDSLNALKMPRMAAKHMHNAIIPSVTEGLMG